MLLLDEPQNSAPQDSASPPPPIDPPDDRDDDDGSGDDFDSDEGGQPIDWVTVASFTEPTAAHVARLRLENEDIPCFIADENMGTAVWHYSIATGGIKLQVPRELALRAAELLGERGVPFVDEADENLQRCPHCGSTRIEFERWSGRRIGVTLLLSLFAATLHPLIGLLMFVCGICFLLTTRRRRCESCGTQWREPSARGFDVIAPDDANEPARVDRR